MAHKQEEEEGFTEEEKNETGGETWEYIFILFCLVVCQDTPMQIKKK